VKRLGLLILAVAACIAVAPAQWSIHGAWDFKSKQPVALVANSIKSAALSKEFTVGYDAFAGATANASSASGPNGLTAGSGVSLTWLPGTKLALTGGLGFGFFSGAEPHVLAYGGVSFRF